MTHIDTAGLQALEDLAGSRDGDASRCTSRAPRRDQSEAPAGRP